MVGRMEGRRPKKVRREGDHEMVASAVRRVREALDASWMCSPFLTPPVRFCRREVQRKSVSSGLEKRELLGSTHVDEP
jgi:hypothetical protein